MLVEDGLNSFAPAELTAYVILDSVTAIGEWAFAGCTCLTSVTIPESVAEIGIGAFSGCTSLVSVTIPDGVTRIGLYAFSGCTGLTSVTIPDSVTEIDHAAFCGCTGLTNFCGKFASEDNRCLVVNGVLNSFAPNGLTEYIIPDSVTKIGCSAFYGCVGLTSITIPNGVTDIVDFAFSGCTGLTSVTISDSVTEIGVLAFKGCTNLISIYCKPTTPPTSDSSSVFDNIAPNTKIYVPRASVNAYKRVEGWCDYASRIEGYDFE